MPAFGLPPPQAIVPMTAVSIRLCAKTFLRRTCIETTSTRLDSTRLSLGMQRRARPSTEVIGRSEGLDTLLRQESTLQFACVGAFGKRVCASRGGTAMNSAGGFTAAREYPLWDAIFGRRSRRVAAGATFRSGSLSFQSKLAPQPLSRLEEAMLIAATGITGLPYWDNPYETADGKPLLGTPAWKDRPRRRQSRQRAKHGLLHVERRRHLHVQEA